MKWEYTILTIDKNMPAQYVLDRLSAYGKEGWELVSVVYHGLIQYFFKRPIQ